jgi:hypothetical protein
MKTTHQYLNVYPVEKNSKMLIVGTIHPHNHHEFKVPFFYGNVLSIWSILKEAFPADFSNNISLKSILTFLNKKKISMSDTIIECRRIKPTALDHDIIPIKLNYDLVNQIKNSKIDTILFTSGFGKIMRLSCSIVIF